MTNDQDPVSAAPDDLSTGSDGLLVRDDGEWALEKLFYIERYIDIFTTGMKARWPRRVYIDLFTGPGRSRVRDTTHEFDGSPLLAAKARYGFSELFLNDADPVVTAALAERIRRLGANDVRIETLDCNEAARLAGNHLFSGAKGTQTLGLAVIDPTAWQVSFEAIREMTGGRKIDLIITFMTGYLRRFVGSPGYEAKLDAFFGAPDWRRFIEVRQTGGKVTLRDLLQFYKERLATLGYRHVNDKVSVANTRSLPIYHLVFASKDPKGQEFFDKISQRRFDGQQRLKFD